MYFGFILRNYLFVLSRDVQVLWRRELDCWLDQFGFHGRLHSLNFPWGLDHGQDGKYTTKNFKFKWNILIAEKLNSFHFPQGLRVTLLLGAFGTTAGAWTNVMSVAPDRFIFFFSLIIKSLNATYLTIIIFGINFVIQILRRPNGSNAFGNGPGLPFRSGSKNVYGYFTNE